MADHDKTPTVQQKLAMLNSLFQSRLPDRFREIAEALELIQIVTAPKEQLLVLHRLLHTLSGSAGTFGFPELGQRSHAFEVWLSKLLKHESIEHSALTELVVEMQEFLLWCATASRQGEEPKLQSHSIMHTKTSSLHAIYVVDEDVLLSKDIAMQLEYFGYKVIVVNQLERLETALAEYPPAAVVMDMMFGDEQLAGANEIKRIKKAQGMEFASIFISTSNEFEKRMAALKAGADAYFAKPLDVLALSDRLDILTARKETEPYRILIVDDDPITSAYYCAVLENAGMEVSLLHRPEGILNALSKSQPELVLMDVYMPDWSGIELARLIRQDNKYLDMPIVFLSSERDLGKQLDAIESGADDFLTKPIKPEHLVSAIANRSERYRSLRSLIMRDGLTFLYNHSAIKEQLGREISRARRSGTDLSLAMIDLDFFKQVNDTHGHPVGDHVIRALARLLQQRLRRCDIIGRYGGEEFAVIFPSTSAPIAKMVLDKIRDFFSKIRHHGSDTEFPLSFSAGIVGLGEITDTDAFFCAADEALYVAKKNGRNRVELG